MFFRLFSTVVTNRNVWFSIENCTTINSRRSSKFETPLSNPVTLDWHLGLAVYRLGHDTTFTTLSQSFGVPLSLTSQTFDHLCRVLVSSIYNSYVKFPCTDAEWKAELKVFIKN